LLAENGLFMSSSSSSSFYSPSQSLDATVSRLLAETRQLLEELEDVKCLDDIIEMLNSESVFYPIIHREWKYTTPISNASNQMPIDEGIIVGSA